MDSSNEDDEINSIRGTPSEEKPFCWQSKTAMRTIRAAYGDAPGTLPYLNSLYAGLTEIASDEGRPSFTKSIAQIISICGGSDKQIRKMLLILEQLGLIHVTRECVYHEGRKERRPSTYTLLSVPTSPVPNPNPSGIANLHSIPNGKNNPNGIKKRTSLWREKYSESELAIIDLYHALCVPRGWRPINTDSSELHDVLHTFHDQDREWFSKVFKEAADMRDAGEQTFTAPKGNKLLRILWANY